jgi:short chain dehydrogenase
MGTVNSGRVDYSSFGLQDKIAIVTGASQGIGRAIALGLARAAAHLVLAKYPDKHQDAIKAVQAEIEALGRKAIIVQTDVAQVDQIRAMVDQAKATFGRVDILVNNAGWTGTTPALVVIGTVAAFFASDKARCVTGQSLLSGWRLGREIGWNDEESCIHHYPA